MAGKSRLRNESDSAHASRRRRNIVAGLACKTLTKALQMQLTTGQSESGVDMPENEHELKHRLLRTNV